MALAPIVRLVLFLSVTGFNLLENSFVNVFKVCFGRLAFLLGSSIFIHSSGAFGGSGCGFGVGTVILLQNPNNELELCPGLDEIAFGAFLFQRAHVGSVISFYTIFTRVFIFHEPVDNDLLCALHREFRSLADFLQLVNFEALEPVFLLWLCLLLALPPSAAANSVRWEMERIHDGCFISLGFMVVCEYS